MTNRGLVQFAQSALPNGLSLSFLMSLTVGRPMHHEASALELGCGEGRALLELQTMHRDANITCLNSLSYAKKYTYHNGDGIGNGLVNGDTSLASYMSTAATFGLPVLETWPTVLYGDYAHEQPLPFASNTMDFVFSCNALNQGKLAIVQKELPFLAQQIARVLRPSGIAVLHLTGQSGPNNRLAFRTMLHSFAGDANEIVRSMVGSSHRLWRRIGAYLQPNASSPKHSASVSQVLPLKFVHDISMGDHGYIDAFLFFVERSQRLDSMAELIGDVQKSEIHFNAFDGASNLGLILHKHERHSEHSEAKLPAAASSDVCANSKHWQNVTAKARISPARDYSCNYLEVAHNLMQGLVSPLCPCTASLSPPMETPDHYHASHEEDHEVALLEARLAAKSDELQMLKNELLEEVYDG